MSPVLVEKTEQNITLYTFKGTVYKRIFALSWRDLQSKAKTRVKEYVVKENYEYLRYKCT